jgi:hypothetical protein
MARVTKTDEQKIAEAATKQAARIAVADAKLAERIAKNEAKAAKAVAMKAAMATEAPGDVTDDEEAMLARMTGAEAIPVKKGRKPIEAAAIANPVDTAPTADDAPTTPRDDERHIGGGSDDAADGGTLPLDASDDDGLEEDASDDDGLEEDATSNRMAQALAAARKSYRPTITASGGKSADCGDGIAHGLEGRTPEETADLADIVCGTTAGFHNNKYGHLNPGQIRMNSGNKIRGQYKKATEAGDKARANEIRGILGLDDL